MSGARPLRVLFLAAEFPSPARPRSGLWTWHPARALLRHADVRVVSPVPHVPPLLGGLWGALRRLPRERVDDGLVIYHPRRWIGPGQLLHALDGEAYLRAVRPVVRRLRAAWPFDLVHAHFVYPDGYAAARLADEMGFPFVVTEHAFWRPWMDRAPRVRPMAAWTAGRAARVIAVSQALRRSIVEIAGESARTVVIGNGVDTAVFTPGPTPPPPSPLAILYVGWPARHKGLDVLLRAMPEVLRARPDARLVVVGESLHRAQAREERDMRALAGELRIGSCVDFAGGRPPADVAARMGAASLVVVPSRRETFGSTVVEAMACGRPVVATKSGGPEEIVTPEVGLLVAREDPAALAAAILDVAAHPERYNPSRLRALACERYAWERVADDLAALYAEVVREARDGPPHASPSSRPG